MRNYEKPVSELKEFNLTEVISTSGTQDLPNSQNNYNNQSDYGF